MNPAPTTSRRAAGFTLIELLTVIAIIGILAAIIIPTVGKVRANARQTQCASNLRQIAFAMQAYAQDNKQRLPATVDNATSAQWNRSDGKVWQYIQSARPEGAGDWERATGTIFKCPSGQDPTQQFNTYGKNSSLGPRAEWATDKNRVETPLSSIGEPTMAVLVMDHMRPNLTSTLLNTHIANTSLRHDSRFNIAYVAGNMGSMTRAQLETLQSDFSDARLRFWSGN